MEKLVVANWKANLTLPQAQRWLATLRTEHLSVPGMRVVVAVPFLFLSEFRQEFKALSGFSWAAQDVSSFPLGNYTGSVPAAWLNGQVDYVIVGHRERRKYFHETIQDVANKVTEALDEDIHPILCVDLETAGRQAAAVDFKDMERITVAYTPDDAEQLEIARGRKSLAEEVQRVSGLFPGARILYGGGVNADNVHEFFLLPGISGVMVAGGCIDPQAFVRLLGNARDALGSGH